MNQKEIEHIIRKEFNFDKKIKIRDINFEKATFKINFGPDFLFIRLPKEIMREYKLKQLLK
jgi:hypothetical protein